MTRATAKAGKDRWRKYTIASDASHHLCDGTPAYEARFFEVLKFHAPGLSPVLDASGAYHIDPDGCPAYIERHIRAFGFYEGRAAVRSKSGWLHILPDGSPLYAERYAWCGNFQDGLCAARNREGGYFHIDQRGTPAYDTCYAYVGDFRDGCSVVQYADGMHTHIDTLGKPIHGRQFLDLDVFHKGFARARDEGGWHHVDMLGKPLYGARFQNVEPFYNGQARVEGFDGSLSVISESGDTLLEIRKPIRSPLEDLSGDMIGMWRTQTIRAAVELGVFEALPSSAERVERSLHLAPSTGVRLMRALTELELVWRDAKGVYHPTEKGTYLKRSHPLSLADAALMWGGETYTAWSKIVHSIRSGGSGFQSLYGANFFDWIQDMPEELAICQAAYDTYAKHDYGELSDAADFGAHADILDAGGGAGGGLALALLRAYPTLKATIMDRPEVIELARVPDEMRERCRLIAGDMFEAWPVESEAVALARILHDWSDADALRILRRAREAMPVGGALYIIEMLLDDSSAGGMLDLHMLVTTGGAERNKDDFAKLLNETGFELADVIPTRAVSSIVRAKAK